MPEICIRKFQPQDEFAIQAITYQTGFKGQGLVGRNFIQDQRLWFTIFIYYYLRYEPENCFVAVEFANDHTLGYICGTPDTHAKVTCFNRKIVPRIIGRLFTYTIWRHPRSFWNCLRMLPMLDDLDSNETGQIAEEYPGHLHINLLPEYHRQGIGSRLMTKFEGHLRALGVTGVHLDTSNHNEKAVPFYHKHGYTIIREVGPVRHPLLDDLYFLTFAKKL